jgi:plastocyanin
MKEKRMKKLLILIFVMSVSATMADAKTVKKTTVKTRPAATAAEKATITITSFQFTPKVLNVAVGTTVVWFNKEGRHTVQADKGEFKSDVLTDGKSFEFTFSKAGKYAYHCSFHGESGGKDMAGTVIVK